MAYRDENGKVLDTDTDTDQNNNINNTDFANLFVVSVTQRITGCTDARCFLARCKPRETRPLRSWSARSLA